MSDYVTLQNFAFKHTTCAIIVAYHFLTSSTFGGIGSSAKKRNTTWWVSCATATQMHTTASNRMTEMPGGCNADNSESKRPLVDKVRKTKKSKLNVEEARGLVLAYLKSQNRPYNAQNISDNLRGAVPKAAVQVAADELVSQGALQGKTYGKFRVYMAAQPETTPETPQDFEALEERVAELRLQLKQVHQQLAEAIAVPTDEELAAEISRLSARLEATDKQLEPISCLDAAEIKALQTDHVVLHTLWSKRKRQCLDLLSELGAEMSQACLIEEIGLETDEDWSVSLQKNVL